MCSNPITTHNFTLINVFLQKWYSTTCKIQHPSSIIVYDIGSFSLGHNTFCESCHSLGPSWCVQHFGKGMQISALIACLVGRRLSGKPLWLCNWRRYFANCPALEANIYATPTTLERWAHARKCLQVDTGWWFRDTMAAERIVRRQRQREFIPMVCANVVYAILSFDMMIVKWKSLLLALGTRLFLIPTIYLILMLLLHWVGSAAVLIRGSREIRENTSRVALPHTLERCIAFISTAELLRISWADMQVGCTYSLAAWRNDGEVGSATVLHCFARLGSPCFVAIQKRVTVFPLKSLKRQNTLDAPLLLLLRVLRVTQTIHYSNRRGRNEEEGDYR